MKKLLLLIILALVVVIQPSYAAEDAPFTIDANDYIIFDEEKEIIEAAGNVIIEMEADSIRADRIQIDLNQEVIKAKGNIILKTEEREMTGSALEYDYRKEEGQVFDSETEEGQITFFGEVVNFGEDDIVLEETTLIPCEDTDEPHYRLSAEKITVYPEDKLIAEGVHLWINERRVMPLPTYKQSLVEGEEEKHAIPQPQVGYSEADGLYVGVDYYHFINQDFGGDISATATTNETSRIDLDYLYQPDDRLKVDPRVYYHQDYGLETYLNLENKIGSDTVSNFEGRYYIERDDEEDEYQDRMWSGRWDLQTKLLNNDLNLQLEQDQDDEAMKETITYGDSWDDYYWELEANRNRDVNRQPQLSLGINNRDLGDGNLLSAGMKVGEIEEDGVEARREQFSLGLENRGKEITDSTELYWAGRVEDSYYDTEDDYRNYAFNLGANQRLGPTDLNIDYRYYDELGESPFEFDRLTEESIGRRDYLSGSWGAQHEMTDSLDFDWQVQGTKRIYEGDEEKGREEQEYNSYGYRTGFDYELNDYQQVSLGYRYQQYSGSTPLEDDEVDYTSHLEGSYRFQTNERVYPYNDVEIDAGYDLKEGEFSRLQTSLIREFDCFSAHVGFDQVEREVNFGMELKY
ncbi:hypothetical protein MWH28_02970 [Natroniella sulfidigena]|uniref:LptA/OstA family protein n=1 Tax=Natroniella sulfidigena TaxID=723921 RepID=UPI00200A4EA5|nr:LptA/OstA family protein [Natroniella sulfidigena]MCK8816325.1 hypothetical protein [Natroniella sulfidigena]